MPGRGRGVQTGSTTRKTRAKGVMSTRKKQTRSVSMTVQEAGRKGGQTVKEKYGPEFYSQIGQKGGEKVQAEAKRYRELKKLGKVKK